MHYFLPLPQMRIMVKVGSNKVKVLACSNWEGVVVATSWGTDTVPTYLPKHERSKGLAAVRRQRMK